MSPRLHVECRMKDWLPQEIKFTAGSFSGRKIAALNTVDIVDAYPSLQHKWEHSLHDPRLEEDDHADNIYHGIQATLQRSCWSFLALQSTSLLHISYQTGTGTHARSHVMYKLLMKRMFQAHTSISVLAQKSDLYSLERIYALMSLLCKVCNNLTQDFFHHCISACNSSAVV